MLDTADQKLIAKWDNIFKACQEHRNNFEKQWHANLAFYFGRQWITFHQMPNAAGYNMSEPRPSESWRVRHTTNKIKRVIRNEITKLTKEEFQFYVVPATAEEGDRAAALAGEGVADFLLHSRNFNAIRRQATFWACVLGTSFMKTYYDNYQVDQDGKPGKIIYEAVTPFHLFVPYLQIVGLEEQPFVIHARTLDPELLHGLYEKDVEAKTETASSILDSRFLTAIGVKESQSKSIKQCYAKEVWLKPCKDFPQGAMFIYANNQLLMIYEGEVPSPVGPEDPAQEQLPMLDIPGMPTLSSKYPYQHNQFPFAKIDHIPTGRFYAQSAIDDLIPVQKEYNKTRSLMLETRNIAGKPQWAMTKGAFDPSKLNTKPGLVLQVNPGFKEPIPLVPPPMPQHVKEDLEICVRDMDDISGQFEISKGRTPPGVEAASAIAYLQEENDSIMYHTVASIEDAVQTIGRQSLALAHQWWTEERIVQVVSRNNTYEAKRFKASDLQANLDFRIEADSMAPRSRAAKQAFITELMKMGVIPPEKGMRYLQMNETNRLYEELRIDERHAQRENAYMAMGVPLFKETDQTDEMGQPLPLTEPETNEEGMPLVDEMGQPVTRLITINEFDNHPVHIYEHENFMKSQEYEMLPYKNKKIFLDHLEEHKMELAAEQQMQAQMGPPEQEMETASAAGNGQY